MTEPDPEEALTSTLDQTRTNTEPKTADADDETPELDGAVADALAAIDNDELHENITLRDKNLAALFEALAKTERLEAIQRGAEAAVDRDEKDVTTAAAARALIRVGLQEVGEDVLADAKDGREKYILEKESDF